MGKKSKGRRPERQSKTKPGETLLFTLHCDGDPSDKTTVNIDISEKASRAHKIPEDEQLFVSAPPSSAKEYDAKVLTGVHSTNPEMFNVLGTADLQKGTENAKELALSKSAKWHISDGPVIEARDVLGHVDVKCVADPQRLKAAIDAVKTSEEKVGVFWEWPAVSTCEKKFLIPSERELDLIATNPTPYRSSSSTVMLSKKDFWLGVITDSALYYYLLFEESQGENAKFGDVNIDNKDRRIPFETYLVGAEVGDHNCMYAIDRGIMPLALDRKRFQEPILAINKYADAIRDIGHPSLSHDLCFLKLMQSQLCSAEYARGRADSADSAAKAAHFSIEAARLASDPSALVSIHYYIQSWGKAGRNLLTIGEQDLAQRAYCWSFAMKPSLRERLQLAGCHYLFTNIYNGVIAVSSEVRSMLPDLSGVSGSRQQQVMRSTLSHEKDFRRSLKSEGLTKCHGCNVTSDKKKVVCSACKLALYCNAGCQSAHWPTHKAFCKANRKKSKSSKK